MKLATTTGDFASYCKTYTERIQHLYLEIPNIVVHSGFIDV